MPSQRREHSGSRQDQRRARVAGVVLTHPDRVLYPEQGVTKLDLARYYERIATWILPQVTERPLSLVRCPSGEAGRCFVQKHPHNAIATTVPRMQIEEGQGVDSYLYVRTLEDMLELVQAGALEFHTWGCRVDAIERPDRLVLDLDPGPGVDAAEVVRTAQALRERLAALGLTAFVRTTGGKGLHLVVPLIRRHSWEVVKAFAEALCVTHAHKNPRQLTTRVAKTHRHGRILLDYFRNTRGATAIASYSARARPGAPVAVPLRWGELCPGVLAEPYHVDDLPHRLAALGEDPWVGFADARRVLNRELRSLRAR